MDIGEIASKMEGLREQGYEKYITVKGIRIRYMVLGSGSPVLLVHGLGGFFETWGFNIFPLSEHYQVFAIDLPGHGLSDRPKNCYTLAFTTEFTAAIMEALGIKRASLIGHSMGGAISINTAINLPERVNRLILVDSAGLSQKLPLLYRLCSVPILGKIIIKPTIKPIWERGIRRLFYNSDFLSEEILDAVLAISQRPGAKEALLSILRYNVNLNGIQPEVVMTEKLRLIRVPTLFVHGAQDKLIPLEHVQNAFSLIPKARSKVFDQCGHCPHIEKSIEFNELVMAFLAAD